MTAPAVCLGFDCLYCEPVLGPGHVDRTSPFGAWKVLQDAKREEGGLWLGVLEIRAEDVPLSDLRIRLSPGVQPGPDEMGFVFQCVACDRLGVVFQAAAGGSHVTPVVAWPNAPEPETVRVRTGQMRALFRRMMELETRVCELEDRADLLEA
ncbi:hypothetical protein [Kitasatospora aureofaciens]|uniref:hypothetical protein n=1 Tax=Kitasatospora aureofaciens TaxID=1894 RepID=UPI001C48D942|nr:hypothetical protein [Kitasatospora aureofaciens]MBV6702623.1 hypothetical protein [Kitasatospora aureofaciens]